MKKLLLTAVAVVGFAVMGTSRAEAGVSVGIGIGVPIGGFYPYPVYPAYYPYAYPYGYYRPAFVRVVHRPYYWYHGRRIYYGDCR